MITKNESEAIEDYKELMFWYENGLQNAKNLIETEYWLGKVNQLSEWGFMSHIQIRILNNEYVNFAGA